MITISLCMIVKNEERVLARCLDSVADLMDEIVIVDTGSTDKTKEIAAKYTDKIYDFVWIDDFSAARNFAFSKANMEYVYSADADEVLDGDNRERFRILKENLLPEIELVQMKYGNQLQFGTVYNFDEEYRPKLFKRKRDFIWEEPIHETVRISPVIYDSDVVITHMPEQNHAGRDLANFRKQTEKGVRLSKRLHNMYAKELFLAGSGEDFVKAAAFFRESAMDESRDEEELVEACLVAARAARVSKDAVGFFKYASKIIAGEGCSEICCELGCFYEDAQDYTEAVIWYYNAVYETAPVLKKTAGDVEGLEGLIRCYEKMGQPENAQTYREELHVLRKGMKNR
ncbi:MAG: glycosyltransferase family 2 protein [Lachnoclostridium sp.]|nr:glycosyltransferase family 2 protein [Lachnospira sp.]MCM1248175.1 glycosyltransferase family 2 protein [Lachnoclostridium sp.]MCM1534458.1 glycosyltransferase family 2 protein [Clostridium sp.]